MSYRLPQLHWWGVQLWWRAPLSLRFAWGVDRLASFGPYQSGSSEGVLDQFRREAELELEQLRYFRAYPIV